MKAKSFYEQCYSDMSERIRVRGYSGADRYATRYAVLHARLREMDREMQELKESHRALLQEVDEKFPIDTEARKQLAAELSMWLDNEEDMLPGDVKSVQDCISLLEQGKPVPFGAVDTAIRESIPDHLWDAITAGGEDE